MDIKKLVSQKTDNTLVQFIRYVFVGGAATVVDWVSSALIFFLVFGSAAKYALLSNAAGFLLGLIVNFLISTVWVFGESKVKSKAAEFLGFAAIGLVGLLITLLVTKLFEVTLGDQTKLFQIFAKVVSTAISFFWNFFARKYLLYNKKREEQNQN